MSRSTLSAVLFAALLAGNLAAMAPTVTEDDSGELAGVVASLGVGHPPGYPLYSLAGHALGSLIPLATPAYQANLLGAVAGAAVPALLFLLFPLALRSREERIAALAACLALGVSPHFQRMAVTTEVYLPGLLVLPFFLKTLARFEAPKTRDWAAIGFLSGLLMVGHYIALFPISGAALLVAMRRRRFEWGWAWASGGFLLGLTPLLFLWVRAQADPAFNWEDPKTLERFLDLIGRSRYGALKLTQGGSPLLAPPQLAAKAAFFFGEMLGAFGILGILGMVFAWIWDWKAESLTRRNFVRSLTLMFLLSGPAYLFAANVPLTDGTRDLLERFLFLPSVFVAVLAAVGWAGLVARMRIYPGTAALFFVAVTLWRASSAFAVPFREDFTFYDSWKNLMRCSPPESSLIFDRADEMEFATAYYLRIENRRPDLWFRDANAGASVSHYGDDYYRVWGPPRLERRTRMETEHIQTAGRPVFYATHEPGMIPVPRRFAGLLMETRGAPAPEGLGVRSRDYAPFLVRRLGTADASKRGRGLLGANAALLLQHQLSRGDTEGAVREAKALRALGGKKTLDRIAYFFQQSGDPALAEGYYREALRQMGPSPMRLLNFGVLQENRGYPDLAESLYLDALKLDPRQVRAHKNLAALFWKRSNWPRVIQHYQAVLQIDPNDPDAQRFLSAARARQAAGGSR